ncbi:MAG: beta-N-acetylhexosaminidase [Gemmatimonadaceae bacterium]
MDTSLLVRLGAASVLAAGAAFTCEAQPRRISVVPRPVQLEQTEGRFLITRRTPIIVSAATDSVGRFLSRMLATPLGFPLSVHRDSAPARGARPILLAIDDQLRQLLGAEGYELEVTPRTIEIRAAALAGVFYGTQTLRQLLPTQAFSRTRVAGVTWSVPAVEILDYPRFSWRGAHLDVGRHFMPVSFVKKFIDLLAAHKLNRFHWHLTEDQGWRIAIERYARLTSVGAWRSSTIIGRPRGDSTRWRYSRRRHGGFYTQAQVRDVVAYAAQRFITVVPEIEMPGHAQAAIAAYPELGVTGDTIPVWTRWGVSKNILNASDSTVRFMQNVLDEVLELFPSEFIHIGGDEADKSFWATSPRIQGRIRELGVFNEAGLQSWFIKQMDAYLTSKGRRLIGWDEILEGGLAPGAAVMSWRGYSGGIAAAREGHDVVMAPTRYTYLDYYQTRDERREPLAIGGFLPLDSVYVFEPIPDALTPDEARHVLGAQAQLWTEYMPTPRHVEYMAFPRLGALAEVVWTPAERRDLADFKQRLPAYLSRLKSYGVNYRRPLPNDASGVVPRRRRR